MRLINFILGCLLCLCCSRHLIAEETIEFYAEHLLEVPMDARYLAMPVTPNSATDKHFQLQLGYASFNAGKMTTDLPMLGASYFFVLNDNWGILTSGFYDKYQFSGKTGKAKGGSLAVNATEVPREFAIDVSRTSGSGVHKGAAIALAYTPKNKIHWQMGLAKTQINIASFKTEFTTLDLPENFSGSFDYASHYDVQSLYLHMDRPAKSLFKQFSYQPHLVIVRNSPRVGFQGRFTSETFDYQGDTNQAGNGRHIPDNYIGFGVIFKHKPTGISVDLGASLYNYLVEPLGHGGISSPLLLTFSFPLF